VPLAFDDQTIDLSAGMGVACWPADADNADLLLSRSEIAMYTAKRKLSGALLYDAAFDSASLMAALLLQVGQYLLLWLLQGAAQSLAVVAILAVFGLLRVAVSGLTGLVMIYALLSWVQAHSPVTDLLDRLVAPLLSPIRRRLPLMGGVDLSPLALLLLLQVLSLLIGGLQSMAMVAAA
jgi:uncharacterized protein YggT (Ycf19 family)